MEANAQKHCKHWRLPRSLTASNGLRNVVVPDENWHPLDGVPCPEYVPDLWTGAHVGARLVDAFKTLANLPGEGGGSSSGFWPAYLPEWEDMLAREQSDADLKEEAADAANRVRIRPSAQEITRMEAAIVWPGRYIQAVDVARVVQRVALYRARDLDARYVAGRLKMRPRKLREVNRLGLDQIAKGLRADGVAVF